MEELWSHPSFVVTPEAKGDGAQITSGGGEPAGSYDAGGTVRDAGGRALLIAPVKAQGKRVGLSKVQMPISDPEGKPLGRAEVVKYGLGPRSRKLTASVLDEGGEEVARIEPRDDKGLQLAVAVGASDVITVAVEIVKAGFLRKTRVYSVSVVGEIPEAIRPLVVGATLRYDALLDGVVAASMRD